MRRTIPFGPALASLLCASILMGGANPVLANRATDPGGRGAGRSAPEWKRLRESAKAYARSLSALMSPQQSSTAGDHNLERDAARMGTLGRALRGALLREARSAGRGTIRTLLWDDATHLKNYTGFLERIGRHEDQRQQLRKAANTDSLTGLANRRGFESNLDKALAGARSAGSPLAVFFIDLDGFKNVNDTLGHSEGDRLLKDVAQTLRATLRSRDMVGRSGDMVGRPGGDEFLVMSRVRTKEEAQALGTRIVDAVKAIGKGIGASVGIAMQPGADGKVLTGENAVKLADQAMYKAKKGGKNRWVMADLD